MAVSNREREIDRERERVGGRQTDTQRSRVMCTQERFLIYVHNDYFPEIW